MAIILDYFSFHILIHLTLIGLDSYIAYWLILSTFSNESTHFTAPTGRTVNDVVFKGLGMGNLQYEMRICQKSHNKVRKTFKYGSNFYESDVKYIRS